MNWMIRLEKICEKFDLDIEKLNDDTYSINNEFVFGYYEPDQTYYVDKIITDAGDYWNPPTEDLNPVGHSKDMEAAFRLLITSVFDDLYKNILDCEASSLEEQYQMKYERNYYND